MIKVTKKLAIFASLALLSAGQFSAFGSHSNNDDLEESGKRLVAATPVAKRQLGDEVTGPADPRLLTSLPKSVMKLIFLEASKVGADPHNLMTVNPHWARSMRYVTENGCAAKVDSAGIPYPNPGPANFMVDCMRLYMEGIVSRGVLYYKKDEAGKERAISFSPDGTAILADCGSQDRYQVFTLSEDRLNLVRGANENKLVTFFGPFHKACHLLPAEANGTLSDIVVIWKWGNDSLRDDQGVALFDYLIIKPGELGANMLDNWKKSVRYGALWKLHDVFVEVRVFGVMM